MSGPRKSFQNQTKWRIARAAKIAQDCGSTTDHHVRK